MKLNFNDAAVLVWLPKDQEPATKHFKAEVDLGPPYPNPEGCWSLGSALLSSRAADRQGKQAWVKVGGVVLSPLQVLQAYEAFKNGREFDA